MAYQTIVIERIDGVAKITLNRPEVLNAINTAMRTELYNALEELKKDPSVRVIVLTGAPRIREKEGVKEIRYSFSVGWDMSEALRGPSGEGAPEIDLMSYIENYDLPVIAMVNGYALGGGLELALACDFIFASENSEFGSPEIDRGFMPGWGATQRLPRRIGLPKAKMLILTGDRISAREAEKVGLVDVVAPLEKLEEVTLEFAKKLASKAPLAVKAIKYVMNKGMDLDLQSGLKLEREYVNKLAQTEDFREGIRAFFERRQPQWKGR